MKLDRAAGGRGKYGLVLNRRLAELEETSGGNGGLSLADLCQVKEAVLLLERLGILDWGTTIDTEFFVLRLRDVCALPALRAYSEAARDLVDAEYACHVRSLAGRAGQFHPNCKIPD
jgi:hypothetical protein